MLKITRSGVETKLGKGHQRTSPGSLLHANAVQQGGEGGLWPGPSERGNQPSSAWVCALSTELLYDKVAPPLPLFVFLEENGHVAYLKGPGFGGHATGEPGKGQRGVKTEVGMELPVWAEVLWGVLQSRISNFGNLVVSRD